MPDDRLAAAAAELYGAAPEQFTARRTELVAAARQSGDRDAASAIGALRRPTRAAWVVNTLARSCPEAPHQLAELAAELSAAQRAAQGPRLRELSAERWALIDALTAQALTAAGVTDPPPSLRDEVTQTLSAALSDPGVAAEFAAGRLTRAAQWSGFGVAAAEAGTAGGIRAAPKPEPAAREPERAARRPAQRGPGGLGRPAKPAGREAAGPTAREAVGPTAREAVGPTAREAVGPTAREAVGPTAREAVERQAATPAARAAAEREAAQRDAAERDAAERAARLQQQYDEAERRVAAAAVAAAEANAAEDGLEAEVRELEQRLTRAKDELAAARMRARRAEAAERRARQAFDRF